MRKTIETLSSGRCRVPGPMVIGRFVPALFLVASSCSFAPLTEEEIYDRETARIEVEDKFLMKQMECDDLGGVMVFERYNGYSKKKKLTTVQMKSARCERTSIDALSGVY